MSKRSQLYLAMVITLFGLGAAGLGLMYFFHRELLSKVLNINAIDVVETVGFGVLYSLLALIPLILLLKAPPMKSTVAFFAGLMTDYGVTRTDIWLLSFCAGVGEELLFRGGIQPWLGIWATAFVFVALHGYLNPKNRPLFVYGVLLFVVSAGFGYLTVQSHIAGAMTAHMLIDVGLLYFLRQKSHVAA